MSFCAISRTACLDQAGYDVRADWGSEGLAALLSTSAVVVIVDVLSFSTCVDVAVDRGALVVPAPERDAAAALATRLGAACAGPREAGGFSLSPRSFAAATPGARIVLPSPNGAALSLRTGQVPTFTACLRNATAVARAVERLGKPVTVIAAGERWPSGRLRPALEDWLGAGAVVAALGGRASPEAEAARLAFDAARDRVPVLLRDCASGRELTERGFADDLAIAAAVDVSRRAPRLHEGAFRDGAA